MSNAADGNEVLVFNRQPDGNLVSAGAFSTGGRGTGGSLGNQSAVVLFGGLIRLSTVAVPAGANGFVAR